MADACWTCGKPRCYGPVEHMIGRLRWALTTARHAQPKTFAARLRLLWHDFVIHGLLHRGGERCQDCGRNYPAWRADDADWQRVMGGPSGLLCAACFEVRRPAGRWAHHTDSGPDHHVWPIDDVIEHVTEGDTDCPCGPSTEPVERPDGSYGWLVTHHSLDGRESREVHNAT